MLYSVRYINWRLISYFDPRVSRKPVQNITNWLTEVFEHLLPQKSIIFALYMLYRILCNFISTVMRYNLIANKIWILKMYMLQNIYYKRIFSKILIHSINSYLIHVKSVEDGSTEYWNLLILYIISCFNILVIPARYMLV